MPGGPPNEKLGKSSATAPKAKQRPDGERQRPSRFRVAWRRTLRDVFRIIATVVDHGVRSFHLFMKIIGPCFICLALGLIGFCVFVFFKHLLSLLLEDYGLAGLMPIMIVGAFLLFNTLYNYLKCVLSDPGTPPVWDEAMVMLESTELNQSPPKQCKHCNCLKPARAHHCSVCRRCVLKMDHHCPWINNCVGWGNYRNFVLFLGFLFSSCVFAACVWGPYFYDIAFAHRGRHRLQREGRQAIMTSFMIACSITVALSILGGFHLYLVLTNQTTIEFQLNLMMRREARKSGEFFRNPYDMGRRRNFQQVFGPNPFCRFRWLMPYFAEPPAGDGLSWSSISGLKI